MKFAFMKDEQILECIKKHYKEILEELKLVNDDFDTFTKDSLIKKAIKMDVFQIGELTNKLSGNAKAKMCAKELRGVINIRNFIGHAYVIVDDNIIWDSVKKDIPKLISDLSKAIIN